MSARAAVAMVCLLAASVDPDVGPLLAPLEALWVTVFAVPFTTLLSIATALAGWVWARHTLRRRHRAGG